MVPSDRWRETVSQSVGPSPVTGPRPADPVRGAYRGAFQFMRSTWRRAPKSPGGDPIAYNYKTQAVVAVALKRTEGRGHWPTCG